MKKTVIILAALALALPLGAQELKMEAPNLVAADEQFNVTFKYDGDKAPTDFQWSPGSDFKLVWGPQKGSSTSISIVNGKTTRTSTTTYTYVLMPKSTGTFTLAPASATVRGNTITSGSRTIQVVSGGQQAVPSSGQAQGSAAQEGGSGISSSDIYMRLILSRTGAVVGEGITATLKLYQRVNIAGFEDARFPSFSGFWSQELQAPSNIEFKRENVGGEIFNTAVIRSWNLIPQKSGDLVIDPAELVCLVNVRQRSSGTGSIFDSFFQDEYRTIRKRVSTPAVTVHVKPLPAGAPASFAGGVGRFSMKASLSADSLRTHDAASLLVTVTGTGNTALLEAPKLYFPPDFEVYDVKTTDIRGGRTFEYPFIPRSHGDFVLGPVEYTYYNVEQGRYVTLTSEELPLHVERNASAAPADGTPAGGQLTVSRKDVRDLGSDIRFISTRTPQLREAGRFFVWSPLYWGLLGMLMLAGLIIYLVFRKMAAMRADVAGTRNRGAVKMARRRLAAAGEFLQKNLYSAFYEELHRALLGFVSDKFAMDAADMSRGNIAAKISAAGAPQELAEEFCSLLDECEYARYAPDAGHEAMNAHYESAVSVISRIDSTMKKKVPAKGAVAALALLLLPLAGNAADYADSLWTVGTQAYSEGRFEDARNAWMQLSGAGLASPELYTNIGDAFFRGEDYAHAILYYERALKLDPSFGDARHNLEFARTMVQDRIDSVPEFFLVTWMRQLGWKLPSDAWAVLSLVLFAGFVAMLLLFLLGRGAGARKAGFFTGIALLLLSAGAAGFATWQKRDYLHADGAVVISAVVPVKSAPGAGDAKDLFVLHEGATLRLLDSVGGWVNIELSDGRQGWMRQENVEKI